MVGEHKVPGEWRELLCHILRHDLDCAARSELVRLAAGLGSSLPGAVATVDSPCGRGEPANAFRRDGDRCVSMCLPATGDLAGPGPGLALLQSHDKVPSQP